MFTLTSLNCIYSTVLVLNFLAIHLRFDALCKRKELQIAAICHPFFKLRWTLDQIERQILITLLRDELLTVEQNNLHVEQNPMNNPHCSMSFFKFPAANPMNSEIEANIFLSDQSDDVVSLCRYPLVKMLFLKFNCSTPSSALVKRLFSSASQVFTARRSRLSDLRFEKLLLLKFNKNI